MSAHSFLVGSSKRGNSKFLHVDCGVVHGEADPARERLGQWIGGPLRGVRGEMVTAPSRDFVSPHSTDRLAAIPIRGHRGWRDLEHQGPPYEVVPYCGGWHKWPGATASTVPVLRISCDHAG